ncbi:MAG TPA: family 1 glycosylhydrolase [Fimbriimonadaceae bacterium]|nr:family 1 glycosylhydrolase [Fimbriimonadaceae bacterium]
MSSFIFATGIECSYPTVPEADGKPRRVDELEACGHYKHWRQDFDLVKELGIDFLRFGGPYYRMHLGPGRYDWSFLDETLPVLRDLGITPILDLCHFGVPDWIGNFQNEDWPPFFAEFALAAVQRYPWVKWITPVNEIYIAALYSAEYGYWNEALKSHTGFVRALCNLCKANVLAMNAITGARKDIRFVQSESTQYFHARTPESLERTYFLNERRFLALDLSYAFPITANMYRYLMDNGMRSSEYDWFQQQRMKEHCVMGNDYYARNEHVVEDLPKTGEDHNPKDSENRLGSQGLRGIGTNLGYYPIAKQYFERYRLPLMHTETNMEEPNAVYWLWQNWSSVVRLREDDLPVIGFTWYSLTDQIDWDTALTKNDHKVNPLGLCDLSRNLRDVGRAYKSLVANWKDGMPSEVSAARLSRW